MSACGGGDPSTNDDTGVDGDMGVMHDMDVADDMGGTDDLGGEDASSGDAGSDGGSDAGPTDFTVGGVVSGLEGSGLVLSWDDEMLPISEDGPFTFVGTVASGGDFTVTLDSQPTQPSQTCILTGGTGTGVVGDVTSLMVDCETDRFTLGGDVGGLEDEVVLEATYMSGGSPVVIEASLTANGSFAFEDTLPSGAEYTVELLSVPGDHTCAFVLNDMAEESASGTIVANDDDTLDVRCAVTPTLDGVTDACGSATPTFTFGAVTGATGYTLEYGPSGDPTTETLDADTTSHTPADPLDVGDYVVRVASHVGPVTSAFASTEFSINAVPATPEPTASPAACAGGVVLLSTDAIDGSYLWMGPDGFMSSEQNPVLEGVPVSAGGVYALVVTSAAGCASAPGSVTVTVDAPLSSSFSQTTTAELASNTNDSVVVANDAASLATLDVGPGGPAYEALVDTTIAGGVHDFSSFHVAAGVTVTVTGAEPLVLRVAGPVTIDGTLSANGGAGTPGVTYVSAGTGGLGVAGGADGGVGAYSATSGPLDGGAGQGLGGGGAGRGWSGGGGGSFATEGDGSGGVGGAPGSMYGEETLEPVLAGSGGGGGSGGYECGSGGGGAGGGAIVIRADGAITVTGALTANGGAGGTDGTGNCGGGGGGSGGAIFLTTATGVTVTGTLSAAGGAGGFSQVSGDPYYGVGGVGGDGRIRIDAPNIVGASMPVAYTTSVAYAFTGTLLTAAIDPADVCDWGVLTFDATTVMGTSVVVDVLSAGGSVLASDVASGTSLASLTAVADQDTIRLRATLSRTTTAVTPSFGGWSIAYTRH